jgi:biotin synthase
MSYEEIESIMSKIGSQEDVFGVFLMTMHNFDMDYLLEAVKISRKTLPGHVKLWINTGDLSLEQALELKNAGVEGAYHVLRLREGEDTRIKPEKRLKTYTAIKESGLALYTCCEPIGAEHSVDEIIDRVFMAYEYGIVQQSVMRRTYIPGLPISKRGQITRLRLAQITATVTLSTISYPNVMAVASHEPNLLSLTAGSNITAAEFGKNPRNDMNHKVSEYSLSINECRKMLYEAGYSSIMSANYNQIPLTEEYINQCLKS